MGKGGHFAGGIYPGRGSEARRAEHQQRIRHHREDIEIQRQLLLARNRMIAEAQEKARKEAIREAFLAQKPKGVRRKFQ